MTAARILSQHGNVIAADFRRPTSLEITIEAKSEILYADGTVALTRTVVKVGDMPPETLHALLDLTTGHIATL